MPLPKDLREFIELLNSHGVEYMVVGAHALAFHGYPRYTGDIDILVRSSEENAAKVSLAVQRFGFREVGLTPEDFLEERQIIQLGKAPNRIDILTSIDGVKFDEAWTDRVPGEVDGTRVFYLSRRHLIQNKRATGRTQDRADLEALGAE